MLGQSQYCHSFVLSLVDDMQLFRGLLDPIKVFGIVVEDFLLCLIGKVGTGEQLGYIFQEFPIDPFMRIVRRKHHPVFTDDLGHVSSSDVSSGSQVT